MLLKRLELLKEAGQIDQEIVNYLLHTIDFIEEETNCRPVEDNGAMLFTHLAMAISRQKKGETCGEMEDFLYEQLKADEYFNESKRLWHTMKNKCPIPCAEVEEPFILLHLASYLRNVKTMV